MRGGNGGFRVLNPPYLLADRLVFTFPGFWDRRERGVPLALGGLNLAKVWDLSLFILADSNLKRNSRE